MTDEAPPAPEPIAFDVWWARFLHIAEEADWGVVNDPDAYREYYEDGDSPEEALDNEMEYGTEGGDF